MSGNHDARRFTDQVTIFRKFLSRYLAFPLRVVRYLFHALLQLYSRITSRQLHRIHTNGHPERVASSSQPAIPPGGWSAPDPSISTILPTHTAPSLFTHALQPLPAAQVSINSQSQIFEPFLPNEVLRYDKPPSVKPIRNGCRVIQPLTRDYPDTSDIGDWCACIHPGGALYFHDPNRHVYTDSNMEHPGRRDIMNSCVDELLALAMSHGVQPNDGNIELVVQLLRDPRAVLISKYYFVDHSKRLLFWLHEQRTEMLFEGVRGVDRLSHIKYAVESQYWLHCELYPNETLPGSMLLKELMDVVVHASADMVTSKVSLSPFDSDELSKIQELIGLLQENVLGGSQVHSICVIARFMRQFTKFFNFYGHPAARLDAEQSVYVKDKTQKSKLMQTLSWGFNVALFGAPESHMSELCHSFNTWRLKALSSKLTGEWSAVSMFATVMLAVDVSFLAVPSVNVQDSQSVPVISTYISVFCTLGSLVVALLFLTNQVGSIDDEDYFLNMVTPAHGMKALATVLGLPYAMLLWGMVYFMLAFSYQVFTTTSTVVLATTASACGIVVVLTLWVIYAARVFHVLTWLLMLLQDWCFRARQAIPIVS